MEQKIVLKEVSKDTIGNLIEVLNKLQSTIGDDIVNIEISECDEKPKIVLTNVPDYYEHNDPEEYRIIILDNYSNLYNEQGLSKMQTIEKMSKYCIDLRDRYKYQNVMKSIK